jgi:carboxymethylenebutenolidase
MPALTFKRADGADCQGYLAEPPSGQPVANLVVLQEWWGLNDQIRRVADRFAQAGYRCLVPDLYRGTVTLDAAEASHLMTNLNFQDAVGNDIAGAVQHLRQQGGKVGVVGFCMGGVLSILAAMYTDADAASAWYGIPPEQAGDVTRVHMPLQGHFATLDTYFTPAMVDALEGKLKGAGIGYEFYRYDADHAFGNEEGAAYDQAAAELAWRRTLDFFARHLK